MAIINCYDVNGDAIRFLTQWDHDISIRATGVKTSPIPEFRFSNKHSQKSKCISGVVVGDGVKATIPNGFLQEALPIYVQLFYTYPSGDAKTEHTFVIPVKPASMPDGAVYEPVEVRSIVELEKRVKALEENGVPGAGGVPSDPSFDTVSLGGDAGVVIIPEGTVDAPAITFYGAHGDEPVALNNVADATDDRSAPNLGQVKQLVEAHSGQNPPQDGEDGFSPIATVTQTADGATISITDKNGTTTATVTNGKDGAKGDKGDTGPAGADGAKGDKGDKGDAGATGPKGDTGATGAPGKDGVSATHSWSGTTLTITSASGTSSADLKGDKGETGATGPAGYTPQREIDYWTPADQESIVQQVIAALGTPVFGRVDADNNIILTGELADGTYTVKYEDAEGNVTTIGTINSTTLEEVTETIKNWIPGVKLSKTDNTYETVSTDENTATNTYYASEHIAVDAGAEYKIVFVNTEWHTASVCVYDAAGSLIQYQPDVLKIETLVDRAEYAISLPDNAATFRLRVFTTISESWPANRKIDGAHIEKTYLA